MQEVKVAAPKKELNSEYALLKKAPYGRLFMLVEVDYFTLPAR